MNNDIALAIMQELENAPLKIKFVTAAYSYEVDAFLNEEMEKLIVENLRAHRRVTGTPAIFISGNRDVLIAVPYKEVLLDDKFVIDRINGMEEEALQAFGNWSKVIEELREKGHKIGIQ